MTDIYDWIQKQPYYIIGIIVASGIIAHLLVRLIINGLCKTLDISTAKLQFMRSARQHNRYLQTLFRFFGSLVALVIWLAVLFLVLAKFKVNPNVTAGAVGLVGLIIAGLFRDLVVDVVKGVVILSGGHYLVGDYIQVGDISGHVIKLSIQSTTIRTAAGQIINLPNSQCIPSRRYPIGYVNNYIDLVLAEPQQAEMAEKLLLRVGRDFNDRYEIIKDPPAVATVLTRHEDRRPIIRWQVKLLPGKEALITEQVIPTIKRVLEAANIRLLQEPTTFQLNGLQTFRELFNRTLQEKDLHEILSRDDESPTPETANT